MKTKLFFLMTIGLLSLRVSCQSISETKKYLMDIIESNPPAPDYGNYLFSNETILKIDADNFCRKTFTEDEFKNSLIYCRELGAFFSIFEIIDIRDIKLVDIMQKEDKTRHYYEINIYINKKYYSNRVEKTLDKSDTFETRTYKWSEKSLDKMVILVGNNIDAVNKIKKAIIYLGKLYGINVKDGLF